MLSSSRSGLSTPIHQSQRFEISKAASYLVDDPISFNNHQSNHDGFPNSIGEYGMGRLLGRGAFGSVYEVTEIRHKTPLNEFKYAIKIVRQRHELKRYNYLLS
jgi:hypothetical protein